MKCKSCQPVFHVVYQVYKFLDKLIIVHYSWPSFVVWCFNMSITLILILRNIEVESTLNSMLDKYKGHIFYTGCCAKKLTQSEFSIWWLPNRLPVAYTAFGHEFDRSGWVVDTHNWGNELIWICLLMALFQRCIGLIVNDHLPNTSCLAQRHV